MKTVLGDLLNIEAGVILHQVNCMGVTGGLAGALRSRWPSAFIPYQARCRTAGTKALGTALVARTALGPRIAHIFGQVQPGANTDLRAVDAALANLAEQIAAEPGWPMFAPYLMGCGLGGGRWEEYAPLLDKHFPSLTIVQLPAIKHKTTCRS